MLAMIKRRLNIEIGHYRALSSDVRHLLISYYLYLMAYPLFAVFTNAYLWRQGQDVNKLIIYNLLYCVGLPLGFYANGLLLRYFHALKLYALGGIIEALVAVLIVMFPVDTIFSLVVYGLLAGVGSGLFWGNKNYLSLRLTKGSNRLYYNTLESVGDTVINMIIPALAGIFIMYGGRVGWYLPDTAYKILMFISLILVTCAGLIVQSSNIKDLKHESLFVYHHQDTWNFVRLYNILSNVVTGVEYIIPSVLVLTLVGKEDALGIISSITAIISALSLYSIGRLGKIEISWKVVRLGSYIFLLGAIFLAIFYSPGAVIFYMAVVTLSYSFRWSPSYTVVMEAMDKEGHNDGQYAYICDNELTFNLGRSLGICLVFVFMNINQTTALRFVPILAGVATLLSIIPLKKLSQQLFKTQT